ncbi:hypothetical protein C7271_13105 [filamentous cyanobacterium CCP5]|nr:hypothetical protein C7271_13105 [filamentous cyanobacterium CCP5]
MLKTQLSPTVRQGWQIQVSAEKGVFYFECCPPGCQAPCDDGLYYPTQEAAFAAACEFVDREVAVLATIKVANEWLATGLIEEEEYWNLTDFA